MGCTFFTAKKLRVMKSSYYEVHNMSSSEEHVLIQNFIDIASITLKGLKLAYWPIYVRSGLRQLLAREFLSQQLGYSACCQNSTKEKNVDFVER